MSISIIVAGIMLVIYLIKFIRYLGSLTNNKAGSGPEGVLQLDVPDEEIRIMFPGGEAEINQEVKKLQALLPKPYPKDLIKLVLVATSVFYKQSGSKDEKSIIPYILKVSDNLISLQDALIIYDFIYTKLLRELLGPIVGESNLGMLKGMVQFKGRDDVDEINEVKTEDKIAEASIDYNDSAAYPSDVPEEIAEITAGIFPGGAAEIEKESLKLNALLQKAYPKALVRSLFVDGSIFFVQSDDKSEEKLIAYLKQIANVPLPTKDAKKIHDFIYTRGLRLAMGKSDNDVAFLNMYNDIDELTGCDADEIPEGRGRFGLTLENPVPVKGIISNDYYLSRLRTEKGERITWERIGSRKAVNIQNPVDVYKIMDLDDTEIARIYISPYHKRVSNKAPAGFKLLFKSDLEAARPTITPFTEGLPAEPITTYPDKEYLEPAAMVSTTTDADGNEEVTVVDTRLLMATMALMTATAALLVPDPEKANKQLQQGIMVLDSFPGPDDVNTTNLLFKASQLSQQFSDAATAERLLERALKAQLNRKKTDQQLLSDTLHELGVLLLEKQDFLRAASLLRQSLQIRQTLLGPDHELTARTALSLGLVLQQQGPATPETELLFRQALPVFQEMNGQGHPEHALVLDNLARVLVQQGNHLEALPLAEKAYALRQAEDISSESLLAQCMSTLAIIYKRQGQLTKAESMQRQLLAILEKAYGTQNREFGAELGNLAGTLMEKGEEREARELFYRALYIKEEYLPAEHPSIAHTLINLAGLHAKEGEFTKAEPLAKRAYQIRAQAFGDMHPETQQSFGLLQKIREDKKAV